MKLKRVLIMAGGTGGHVFPALAIAKALKDQGVKILWLGSRGRMEERLVPKYGFDIAYIKVRGVRRNGLKALAAAPFMVARAVCEAMKVIGDFKPDAVVGMGGYASGPGGVAAFLKGIPVILHEQNAAAGLTNRLLFKIAKKAMLGFPGAFSGSKVCVTGNPVRSEILGLYRLDRNFDDKILHVAVVGGSLGASALNLLVPKALSKFGEGKLKVTHQCGLGNSQKVAALYGQNGFKAEVCDFIDDMCALYRNCDLIICRAGALTVAETCAAGLPAIFIPLPTAVDDHQTKNASFLAKAGAAFILNQRDLNERELYEKVKYLDEHREKLNQMSQKAYDCAVTDATERAVNIIKSVVES